MPDDDDAVAVPWPAPWMALAFAGIYAAAGVPAMAQLATAPGVLLGSIVLGLTLAVLSAIDLRTFRLPDALTLPLICAGLLFCYVFQWENVTMRALAAASGFLALYLIATLYQQLRGRAGLGLGDAKLLAASGAWLGLVGLPTVVLAASCTALLAVLVQMLRGITYTSSSRIAFGPFLALGTWLVWLYGPLV